VQLPSFGAFLQLLQTNNDVNVLSNPSLLITNNQEGEISVGENLPFPGQLLGGFGGIPGLGGQQQGALGGLGGFPSVGVQRQDVALKMKLTPSVNDNNMIRMEVDQEISDVSAPNFNGLGPATSKRSAKTTVVARDQQTVVIGGLMTDRASETVKKIPILGDIPVLGFFFRSTSKTMKKSNIIIALTPYVISDLDDLRRVAEKKLRERREFIDRYSALDDKTQLEANIDYRRKRGMLEEINRTAREIDNEETELRQLRERERLEDTVEISPPGRTGPSSHYLWRKPVSSTAPATPAPKPAPATTPAPSAPAPAQPNP
jgi:general secretion pathway protein D